MADRFLSYDAFGPYRSGGIVDAVIDRFEREGVDYRNVVGTHGAVSIRYPAEAQHHVDNVAQDEFAARVARLVPELARLLEAHLGDTGHPLDAGFLAPLTERVCEELDLAHDLCAECARTFPLRALSYPDGVCAGCRKETPQTP